MTLAFADPDTDAIDLFVIPSDDLDQIPKGAQAWAQAQGFMGQLGRCITVPSAEGAISCALVGYGTAASRLRGRFHIGVAARKLPHGIYQIVSDLPAVDMEEAALGWLLETYRFDYYISPSARAAMLVAPMGVDAVSLAIIAAGEAMTRDLINTPASDMGPYELEEAFRALAKDHDAEVNVILGDDLLSANFPMIHTVGRASTRAPRLLDMRWGTMGPKLT